MFTMKRLFSALSFALMISLAFGGLGIIGCGDDGNNEGGDVLADVLGNTDSEPQIDMAQIDRVAPDVIVDDTVTTEIVDQDTTTIDRPSLPDVLPGPCTSVFLDTECPAGFACRPSPDCPDDSTYCCVFEGNAEKGDECTASMDCKGATTCIDVEDDGTAVCLSFCDTTTMECEGDELCNGFSDVPDLGFCVPPEPPQCEVCNVDTGETQCDVGDKCTLGAAGLTCDTIMANPAQKGDRCGAAGGDDCGDGLICSGSDPASFVCSPLCEPLSAADVDCCEGLCIGFMGYETVNLGVCIECNENCDVYCQTGCADGQKCTIVGDCTTDCTEAGTIEEGAACGAASYDDCAPGLYCDPAQSKCVKMCRTDLLEDPCGGDTTCISFDSYGMIYAGYCGVFPTECSVINQDCTEAGTKCTLGVKNNAYAIMCDVAGTVQGGELCGGGAGDDCAPGFMCLGSSAENMTCMKVCEPLSGISGCDEGMLCSEIGGVPSGANIGYCTAWNEECSVVAQDCAEGMRCSLGMEGIECVPDGTIALGEVCSGGDICMAGTECFGTAGETFTCQGLCEPQSDVNGCPEGAECGLIYGLQDFNIGVCMTFTMTCNPVPGACEGDTCCAEGEHCKLAGDGTECVAAGPSQTGEECVTDDDCAQGLLCVSLNDPCISTCESFCDINNPVCEDTAKGEPRACAYLGLDDLGVCVEIVTNCSIVTNEPCADGEKCTFTGASFDCYEITGTKGE